MTGIDNWTGPTPALLAEDVERLLRAMDNRPTGFDRGTAGIAAGFGLSRRTLYRYWPGRVEWVVVDGYRIPFLCRPGRAPIMLDARRGGRTLPRTLR